MKQLYLFLSLIFFSVFLNAQTVENIRAEQNGTKINIYYEIKNSSKDQLFKVQISAKINNDKTINLTSVTGDVGDNIKGGKASYLIEWDVLKDVERLTNSEFFVKIELKNDGSTFKPINTITKKGRFFVAYQTAIGIKTGYMSKWGFAISTGWDDVYLKYALLGSVTKSIVRTPKFQWNIYPLVGLTTYYSSYYSYGEYFYYRGTTSAWGFGTDLSYGHFYFNYDNYWDAYWGELGIMAGIGWRF